MDLKPQPLPRTAPLALGALLALAFAAAPAHAGENAPAVHGDLARLQGKWTTRVKRIQVIEADILIKGREVTINLTTPEGQDVEIKGELKVNDDARPFRTVDWVKFTDPIGDGVADNFGIYEFDGEDRVKVCNGGPGKPRPTEFKGNGPFAPMLLTMTRKADGPR